MKRIMEEAATHHVEAIHYSILAGICVSGEKATGSGAESGFWPLLLEGFHGKKLKKEEVNRAERRVREVTGWSDPVEDKIGFVEAAWQNCKVLVKDKWAGKAGGVGPSGSYDTRSGPN